VGLRFLGEVFILVFVVSAFFERKAWLGFSSFTEDEHRAEESWKKMGYK